MAGQEMKKTNPFLVEARRLFELGLAPHWLVPGEKRPTNKGWQDSKRGDWLALRDDFQNGKGLGVRLGAPSCVNNKYLAVIDFDVRSAEPRFYEEAIAVVRKAAPQLANDGPHVRSGRGFRSGHFYFFTKKPIQSRKLGVSKEIVKVFAPSSPINRKQEMYVEEGRLSPKELRNGFRMKAAWEVELMSEGKQVVVPPTIHPDTKLPYKWLREL